MINAKGRCGRGSRTPAAGGHVELTILDNPNQRDAAAG